MAFLFNKSRQRSNVDLCRTTRDLLQRLESNVAEKPQLRSEEELARNLTQMKFTLQGTAEVEASPQQVYQLVHLLMSEDVLLPLARNIHRLPFESRKDVQVIFSHVFRFKPDTAISQNPDPPIINYVLMKKPELIAILCNGYDIRESAMVCGSILREALKYDSVAALILYHEPKEEGRPSGLQGVDPSVPASGKGVFWKFFEWVDKGAFEVSADAFSTFRELMTKHKKLSSHFLLTNYSRFIAAFHQHLLLSPSYVTKRQSLQLLSGLLLERNNYNFMQYYVESADHLKIAMKLLRDDRRMIQYEGFHVFKVFVANPQKSAEVQKILITNRDKLLDFLPKFLADRRDDMQFEDEKAYLIRMIEQLPAAPVPPMQSQSYHQQHGPVMA